MIKIIFIVVSENSVLLRLDMLEGIKKQKLNFYKIETKH
jgi:hypothetical protein